MWPESMEPFQRDDRWSEFCSSLRLQWNTSSTKATRGLDLYHNRGTPGVLGPRGACKLHGNFSLHPRITEDWIFELSLPQPWKDCHRPYILESSRKKDGWRNSCQAAVCSQFNPPCWWLCLAYGFMSSSLEPNVTDNFIHGRRS